MTSRTLKNTPSLAELQASFQKAILDGDDAILSLIPGNGRANNEVLFGVYRNAYVGRLIGVMAAEHEYLKAYLGDEQFHEMATAFVKAHPSHTQNARWYAEALPVFLKMTEPYDAHPEVAELALIERTLARAFDAKDADTIALPALQAIDPSLWETLIFKPHPAVHVLPLMTNALALWQALKDDVDPPEVDQFDRPQAVLIWRPETTPMIRAMADEEAMMWMEAAQGVNFGRLCELLVVFDDPDTAPLRAAQYLAGWLANGLISAVVLTADVDADLV